MAEDWIELVQESVIVSDAGGRILAWNGASARLYGHPAEAVLGRPLGDFFAAAAPSHAVLLAASEPVRGAQLRHGANGAPLQVQLLWTARRVGGALQLVETGIDISACHGELVRGEAFYRDMFRTSAVSTWHLDARRARQLYADLKAQGVTDILAYADEHPEFVHQVLARLSVVDVNDTTVQLFGGRHRDELIGDTVAPFWIPGQYQTLLGSVEASFNNRPHFRGETPMRTLDGRRIDVLFTVAASAQLRAVGQALLNVVDITERVQAQHALIESQAQLAQAVRLSSLGGLATSIAHEINQPLAAITTHGEAAQRWLKRPQPDLDEIRDLNRRMIDDARRASAILGRIRSMATPQARQQRPLALNALVRDTLLFMAPELHRAGVHSSVLLADDLPDIVADAVQLQQVLVNLFLNATQAMADAPERRLTVRSALTAPQSIELAIGDSGPGIAADALERVFQSFYTTKADGMGIGLAICRSLVEDHGGTIVAGNAAAGGACFTLRLPLAAAAS